jgi:two-component system, NarL family, response regulator
MVFENPIRILIADDHPLVLEGMVSIISSDPMCKVVAKAYDGQGTVKLFHECEPDVAIIDLRMPKMDGLEAIVEIRKSYLQAKIIVLSAYDSEELIYQAIQAGAKSYVLKGSLVAELVETIKAVHQGKCIISGEIAAKYVARTSRPTLSGRELEVLQLMSQGKSNAEIALGLTLTEGTVKVHVHNIFSKLELNDRVAAVMEAVKRGIIHP